MELHIAKQEIAFQNEERKKREAEFIIANKELVFQNQEKEKRAAELIIANRELVFQHEEKEMRASELIAVNKELAFQNEEKGKRADELILANKELAFQNEEKEKRARELIIANGELVFQHAEKEKRAAELIVANEELAFQNKEKEKRAEELTIANKELAFQNQEKGRRAEELTAANRELEFQNEEKEKRAEELVNANKELESFSYSVSHDLRSPLRSILGYAKMLFEDYGTTLDPEGSRLINNIMTNAKKMGQLLDDLLTFSRLSRKALVKTLIPMRDMVDSICSETLSEKGDRNIRFEIAKLPFAYGDRTVIKQVWLNLISNAVKYTRHKEEAVIEIGSEVVKDSIVYSIKDNGAGFDMRYADKLFGVFQRLHTDAEFEGTGVGLAIVHRIVTKHGGAVWADGKVNEGATFHFSLPKTTNDYETGN